MEDWQKKGEFEKTTDWQDRLKESSLTKFYELCNAYSGNYSDRYVEYKKYNPDLEEATFCIYLYRGGRKRSEAIDSFRVSVPMSADEVKEYAERRDNFGTYRDYDDIYQYNPDWTDYYSPITKTIFLWGNEIKFVNGYFSPMSIIFFSRERAIEIFLDDNSKNCSQGRLLSKPYNSFAKIEPIKVSFNSLGINNIYLEGCIFEHKTHAYNYYNRVSNYLGNDYIDIQDLEEETNQAFLQFVTKYNIKYYYNNLVYVWMKLFLEF